MHNWLSTSIGSDKAHQYIRLLASTITGTNVRVRLYGLIFRHFLFQKKIFSIRKILIEKCIVCLEKL